ncbi:MAG: hypothetical protein ACYS3N_15460 [Planctomycetota bacterium]|jgi:hypothetical protein
MTSPKEAKEIQTIKKEHPQNSLLCTIAGIHGRFLSIICGIMLAFYMYSYEQAETLKGQLNDLRLRVARMMISVPTFGDPKTNVKDYFNEENVLMIDKIVRAFNDQLGYIPDIEAEKLMTTSGINVPQTFQYEQRLTTLAALISIVAHINPYSTVSERTSTGIRSRMYRDLQKDWDPQWQRDLGRLNSELVWIWRHNKTQIEKLLRHNERAIVEDQINKRSNDVTGKLSMSNILANIHREVIEPFFHIVELINRDIISQLNDNSFKLQRYRTRLRATETFICIGFLFIGVLLFGILIPLIMASRPVFSRKKVLAIMAISFLLHFGLVLFTVFHIASKP